MGTLIGALLGMLLMGTPSLVGAQTCTTQAKMTSDIRSGLSDAAMQLAQAVQQGDGAKVQATTIAEFASAIGLCADLGAGAVDLVAGGKRCAAGDADL